MALSHHTAPVYGVQFHPESILTEFGHALFANFLRLAVERRPRVLVNGALQEGPVVSFDLTDRGLNLGDGVFDTSLARNGRIFRRKSHIDRMADACEILGIPFDETAAGTALDALAEAVGDGAVRLTLTRGPGPRGLSFPKNPAPVLYGSAAAMHTPPFPVFKTWDHVDPPQRNLARVTHQSLALSRFRARVGTGLRARCGRGFVREYAQPRGLPCNG